MQKTVHEARSLGDAVDCDWLLVISREIAQAPDQAQFLEMYHYPQEKGTLIQALSNTTHYYGSGGSRSIICSTHFNSPLSTRISISANRIASS